VLFSQADSVIHSLCCVCINCELSQQLQRQKDVELAEAQSREDTLLARLSQAEDLASQVLRVEQLGLRCRRYHTRNRASH